MESMKFEIVPLKWQNNEWEWDGQSYGEYPKTAKQALKRAKQLAKHAKIAVRIIVQEPENLEFLGDCQVMSDGTAYCMGNGIVSDSTIRRMFGLRN